MSIWPRPHSRIPPAGPETTDVTREVERTLALLDNVRHAPASPFFYTRLKARIQTQNPGDAAPAIGRTVRLSLAVTAATLLLLANVYSIVRSTDQSHTASKDQQISSVAEVYAFTDDSY